MREMEQLPLHLRMWRASQGAGVDQATAMKVLVIVMDCHTEQEIADCLADSAPDIHDDVWEVLLDAVDEKRVSMDRIDLDFLRERFGGEA